MPRLMLLAKHDSTTQSVVTAYVIYQAKLVPFALLTQLDNNITPFVQSAKDKS